MKLFIELVPNSCWFKNLRTAIPRKEWDIIRKESYAKAGNKCEICKAGGRLNCHEVWEYDDKNRIQTLERFQALCDMCHRIKHIGLWCHTKKGEDMLQNANMSKEDIINHFCKVNNCSKIEFEEHENKAFEIWRERSGNKWKTDLGEFGKKFNINTNL